MPKCTVQWLVSSTNGTLTNAHKHNYTKLSGNEMAYQSYFGCGFVNDKNGVMQ